MSFPDNHLYEFAPFQLDAANRILVKDGVTVRLTPKAFETLLVLVQHGGQVVDKDQLLKEVWPDSFVEEGSLTRNIHELRKALGDDSSERRHIETIPKRGYRFIAPLRISLADTRQIGPVGIEGETTYIEKHTFARVYSEELEKSDSSAITTRIPQVEASEPLALTAKKILTKNTGRTLIIGLVLLVAAVGVFLSIKLAAMFVKHPGDASVAHASHAKSTLVRLTNNNAIDAAPSWSPDGSKIAFRSNRDGKSEIYVTDSEGSNVKRLTNNLAEDDSPQWSPDGRKILFESDRDGNREIYVMDADGSNQMRLTRNSTFDAVGSWSPDGTQIAFASNRDNPNPYNFDIYLMNADGSNVRRIVDDLEFDAEPKWSPDGRKFMFVTGRNNRFDLYQMNADGTNQRNLTVDGDYSSGAAAWSLDGHNISFMRNVKGKEQIFVMDAEGNNVLRLTDNSANNGHPVVSPDGSKVVFQTDRDGNWEIYVMSIDGELLQLTDEPADDLNPDWSPDGSKIAFSSNRAGKQHIYVMNADGEASSQITKSEDEDTDPSWSPDGKRIAFVRTVNGNSEIYAVNADGSNVTRLTEDPANDLWPVWASDGRIFFTSDRDGKRDVYLMDADGDNFTKVTKMGAVQPSWSLVRNQIAFISVSTERINNHFPLQVFVADAEGGNIRMVTRSPASAFVPYWSPDGKTIAYAIDQFGVISNIFQVDADGSNRRRLTAGPSIDANPTFSPDGTKMAFQSSRSGNAEIYVMYLRGK